MIPFWRFAARNQYFSDITAAAIDQSNDFVAIEVQDSLMVTNDVQPVKGWLWLGTVSEVNGKVDTIVRTCVALHRSEGRTAPRHNPSARIPEHEVNQKDREVMK